MDLRRTGTAFAVLLTIAVASCAVRNQHFVIQDGKRLLYHSVAASTASYGLSCVVNCMNSTDCLAANFNQISRECQQCDETPERYGTVVELNTAWILYHVKGPCSESWLYHGTSCYLLVSSTATWSSSSAYCTSLGARHIDLNSQQENDFLHTVYTSAGLPQKMWIGMTDVALEGTFVWASGALVTYWNMSPGEGTAGYEDCIFMGAAGTWGDAMCSRAEHSMCEKPLV